MADQVLFEELSHQLSAVGAVKRELGRNLPPECPPGSAGVLTILKQHGDMRMSQLAELLSVDVSVTSRHVSHVADRGWIKRSPDPDDKRANILHLTDNGRGVLDELSQHATKLLTDRLRDWDDDDVRELTRLLARLRDSFGECRSHGRTTAHQQPSTTPSPTNASS